MLKGISPASYIFVPAIISFSVEEASFFEPVFLTGVCRFCIRTAVLRLTGVLDHILVRYF